MVHESQRGKEFYGENGQQFLRLWRGEGRCQLKRVHRVWPSTGHSWVIVTMAVSVEQKQRQLLNKICLDENGLIA